MLALFAAIAMPVPQVPEILQPKSYVSPSGEWRLSVDPSSKFGDGPARVAVSRGGVSAWEAPISFTFREAFITDSGYAAGYALTDPRGRGTIDELVVAIFAPDGSTLLEEHVERTGSIGGPHAPNDPNPLGAFAQPALDRFVIRVLDPSGMDELWWSYRISTGEPLERARPRNGVQDCAGLQRTMDARPIGGTPLTLVQWYQHTGDTRADRSLGTRFVLVDGDWEQVWTLALPEDFQHPDARTEDFQLHALQASSGILTASAAQRFELRHVVAQQRVTYEVCADSTESTGWSVREVGRGPIVPPEPEALPVLELKALASVPLLVAPSATTPSRRVAAFDFDGVHFDGDGRIALVERRSQVVHLFSESGVRELVLSPDATDLAGSFSYVAGVETTAAGRIYVQGSPIHDRYRCFATDGKRIGKVELGGDRVVFLASGERWTARCSLYAETFVQKLAPDGTVRARVARRPSNEFFEQIDAIGCTPDGAVAVLVSNADGVGLDLFDGRGDPERTIELRGAQVGSWRHLRYGRRWIVASGYKGEALLVPLPDGEASLVRPAVGAEGTLHAFDLSPDGEELWCATLEPPALHRFALPE
jgi:hypothetical protein